MGSNQLSLSRLKVSINDIKRINSANDTQQNKNNIQNTNTNKYEINPLKTCSQKFSLQSSSVHLDLDERISKINTKLENLDQVINKSTNNKHIVNIDSRIKSQNDISLMSDSNIVKNKSFYSLIN